MVIEITSPSTRREDLKDKFALYRDTLQVREYFLFDPYGEYLDPPLRGYRLVDGEYVEIEPIDGRLPSEVTGLHLEAGEPMLQLYDPETRRRLPTVFEMARKARPPSEPRPPALDAEAARREAEAARQQEAEENERLRRELEELRRRLAGP